MRDQEQLEVTPRLESQAFSVNPVCIMFLPNQCFIFSLILQEQHCA
jgi:hypothetical protein